MTHCKMKGKTIMLLQAILKDLIVDCVDIYYFDKGYVDGKPSQTVSLKNKNVSNVVIYEFSGNGAHAMGTIHHAMTDIVVISETVDYQCEFVKDEEGNTKATNMRVSEEDLKHADWRNAFAWMPISDEIIDRSYRDMSEDEYFEKMFPVTTKELSFKIPLINYQYEYDSEGLEDLIRKRIMGLNPETDVRYELDFHVFYESGWSGADKDAMDKSEYPKALFDFHLSFQRIIFDDEEYIQDALMTYNDILLDDFSSDQDSLSDMIDFVFESADKIYKGDHNAVIRA